jgi:hypothetical protein
MLFCGTISKELNTITTQNITANQGITTFRFTSLLSFLIQKKLNIIKNGYKNIVIVPKITTVDTATALLYAGVLRTDSVASTAISKIAVKKELEEKNFLKLNLLTSLLKENFL